MDNITTMFQKHHLKLTPQRIAVYKYLSSTVEHPSVETIYNHLHDDYPTMSLATIYKTLKTFIDIGLVNEINFGEGNFRYDSNVEMHSHMQCTKCGKVLDIYDVDCKCISKEVAEKYNYSILKTNIFFYGICSECSN